MKRQRRRQKAKRPWWTTVKDPECERYNRPPDVRIEFK
jgi:hypothetical protein